MQPTKSALRRTSPTSRRKRLLAAGTAAVSVPLLAALILGSALATTAGPGHIITAPFKGAHAILKNPSSASGCGGGGHLTNAFYNTTSGVGGFASNVSAKWCTSSTNNSASYTGSFAVSAPVHVKTTGTHQVEVVWLTQAMGSVNLTAGTCTAVSSSPYGGCTRSASTFVYGTAYLFDKTAGTKTKLTNHWAGNSTYISNYTSCVYGRCTSKATATTGSLHTGASYWAWYWNGTTLNSTHVYWLKMTIYGGSSVVLMQSGATLAGASANAQFNSATLGEFEQLIEISVK